MTSKYIHLSCESSKCKQIYENSFSQTIITWALKICICFCNKLTLKTI